uniref:Tax1-binding protein 3 n=1 Tax=Scophthalmus maximus TaxID=52904 RepID=A0A8D3ABP9_SCOMX
MACVPGQPLTAVVQRIEIKKLRHGDNLILGFSIGGGIDQDPGQNPFSKDKTDKGIYVTRISPGGPAEVSGLMMGDKIMQVCREVGLWSKSTRWHYVCASVSGGSFASGALITFHPTVNKRGINSVWGKKTSSFSQTKFSSPSQVNGWDMTMVTHDKARQKLTKNNKDVVRLLVTRKSLEEAVKHSMGGYPRQQHSGTYTNDTISKN